MPFEHKQFQRRKLPHIHSPGATLFVTFRLAGSIPKVLIDEWKRESHIRETEGKKASGAKSISEADFQFSRRWFGKFEEALHSAGYGPTWLNDPRIAQLVADSLIFRNGKDYYLVAFCIMSNHVHVVFRPLLDERTVEEVVGSSPLEFTSSAPTLSAIMQSLKGYTARHANKILGRQEKFWQDESYDHEVRDEEELARIVKYVLNNPVKASLVNNWQDWKWNWLRK